MTGLEPATYGAIHVCLWASLGCDRRSDRLLKRRFPDELFHRQDANELDDAEQEHRDPQRAFAGCRSEGHDERSDDEEHEDGEHLQILSVCRLSSNRLSKS